MKKKMTLLLLAPVLLAVFWFASNSRAATETPEYKVIRTDEKFEVRDYPALSLATSPMAADGMNGGFGNLFRFITGTNEAKEKIEMTSPVLISNTAEQLCQRASWKLGLAIKRLSTQRSLRITAVMATLKGLPRLSMRW